MSNITYTHKIKRLALIIDPKTQKKVPVGELEEFIRTDSEIKVNIRLYDNVPQVMAEAIEKNPGCLQILEQLLPPENILIIPTRPPIAV